jgi:eukaryotic-like serine/threonine-protein kinase
LLPFLQQQSGEMFFASLGCSELVSALVSKYRQTTNPYRANQVAWYCALAPDAVADPETPVRLAELALKGYPTERKHQALNTLGAALYRAGRFEDAIRRLEEGIQLRNGKSLPTDWHFLAMAHHRLGHRDEARLWLDRLRTREQSTDPVQFWNELEIGLLRSEAEALILYDPMFPADPFAH